jgi:hypothetical protein
MPAKNMCHVEILFECLSKYLAKLIALVLNPKIRQPSVEFDISAITLRATGRSPLQWSHPLDQCH